MSLFKRLSGRPFASRLSAIHVSLLAGASIAAFATSAVAQGSGDDTIVVTGSRIRQNPLDKAQPLLDVDADDINRSGLNNVGDFLQRIPGSGGGLNSRVNSSGNFGNPPDGGGVGAGSSEIDLRFLGSRRVLVLVDGLRWINGSSASGVPGATDLNTIPSSIIDRIEILQDGASPIYGSDAIAGVVNIITKREQQGFGASAQLGAYDDTDGETQQYELSFGAGNDRTKVFAAVQYVHQNSVSSGDRDISDFPVATLDRCFVTCSSATPRGRFVFTDPNTLNDLSLTLRNGFTYSGTNPVYNPLAPTTGDFQQFTTADRFNFSPYNYVVTPSERWGGFVQLTHELTDNITFRAKGLYNRRNSTNQAAPIPLFIGPEAGNGNRLDTVSVDVTNPYNPFGFTVDASTNDYFFGRRLFEAGPRHFEQQVDTYYLSGTFEGDVDVFGRKFYWDANGLWSKNDAQQTGFGIVNSLNLQNALGPVAACTAPCVPFNFFGGPGSITQAMLDYVTFDQLDQSQQRLFDFSLNFSGGLFDLPAGEVGIAGGYEHRDQRGSFTPDPIVVAGNSADIPAQPTSGRFNVDELYGELKVPVLADVTLFKALEASFAIRYSDYSTGVSTTTIKYGGRWQPFEDLTIRGGFTEGFRAASIGELFGTLSRFDATLTDPCSDYTGTMGPAAPAAIQANCTTLGVPATYVQTNFQISTTTGGNSALRPENSDGWNVGMTYQPQWAGAHNLVAEFNYYSIKITDAIQAPDAQNLLNGCVSTLDPAFCSNITRSGTGTVIAFSNQLTNIGGINTRGIDWRLGFDVPETGIGDFHFEVLANHLLDYTEVNPTATGFVETSREGTLRGSPTFSWPKFKANIVGELVTGPFRFRAIGRYVGSVVEGCPDPYSSLTGAEGCSRPDPLDDANSFNDLGKRFYLDLAASWTPPWLGEHLEFTIGGNNVIGTDPPSCFTCQLNGFDPNTYDAPGRFGYVRITYHP